MKQPTAEDVMAACEVARLYRDIIIEAGRFDDEVTMGNLHRASRVIHIWLTQFDEAKD